MNQTLSSPLLREQEVLYTIYPHKGKILLVSLVFALFFGFCCWFCAANASSLAAYMSSLLPVQQWAGVMLVVVYFLLFGQICLIPLRLVFTRTPLLTFTEKGVYNYYRLGLQPRFLKWEDVKSMQGKIARRYHWHTDFQISPVPSERQRLLRAQGRLIPLILVMLFTRPGKLIPRWVMPLTLNDLLHQIKEQCALPLQEYHISVYLLNLDSGDVRDY